MKDLFIIYIVGVIATIIAKNFTMYFVIQDMKRKDQWSRKDKLNLGFYLRAFWPVIFSWLEFPMSLIRSYVEYKNLQE